MTRIAIRTMMSKRTVPPRFCDLLIEDGRVVIEKKNGSYCQQILWDDLKRQVEEAIRQLPVDEPTRQKLSKKLKGVKFDTDKKNLINHKTFRARENKTPGFAGGFS